MTPITLVFTTLNRARSSRSFRKTNQFLKISSYLSLNGGYRGELTIWINGPRLSAGAGSRRSPGTALNLLLLSIAGPIDEGESGVGTRLAGGWRAAACETGACHSPPAFLITWHSPSHNGVRFKLIPWIMKSEPRSRRRRYAAETASPRVD